MLLEAPGLDTRRIIAHLDDIVRWQLVQRIEVDGNNVFYDINTMPHLHLFDARCCMLKDAPSTGLVRITG